MPVDPRGRWFDSDGPIRVDGGIAVRAKRGKIGEQWWSRRFVDVLERVCDGGRLARGRAYARKGQVMDFHLSAGLVTARVQGSRPQPYEVRPARQVEVVLKRGRRRAVGLVELEHVGLAVDAVAGAPGRPPAETGVRCERPHERGLPHTGLTTDEDQSPALAPCGREPREQRLAFDQHGLRLWCARSRR